MAQSGSPKESSHYHSAIELPFNQRIAFRQARVVVFLALIIGSIISGIQVTVDYFDKQEALSSDLSNVIQTSTQSASEALWTMNDRLAGGVIDGLFVYTPISSVIIKSRTDFDLAKRSRPAKVKQYQWLSEKIFGEKEEHIIPLVAPRNNTRIGVMIITVEPHDEAIAFAKRSAFVFLFGIIRNFFLATILFAAFYITLTRPLLHVANFISNQDREKPGKERIDPQTLEHQGELKVIAQSLNHLLDNLGTRWDELAQAKEALDDANTVLEQRVKERTSELREANELLTTEKERANQASTAKGEFLANMSHEIRTPLNAVLGMIHLTRETHLTFQQQQYLEKAESASKNLLHIINEILDFSKIEAGKLELDKADFDINSVLDNLSNIMNASAKGKKLDMYFDYFQHIPNHFQGDALRLSQVLINLSSNAIKFTQTGYISVKVRAENITNTQCDLKFEVKDSGIGMNKQQIEGIFDAFSQADSSTTRKFGGTGLGLAICKRLVMLMGGDIGVTSQPDFGSTFYFRVTLNLASSPVPSIKVNELANKSVLILDDYTNSQSTLKQMLKFHDMRVVESIDDNKLVASYKNSSESRHHLDCIFIDQDKVETIGLSTTQDLLSSMIENSSTQIILLASNPGQLSDLVHQLHPSHVVTKPFTETAIRQALSALFASQQTNDSSSKSVQQENELLGKKILLVEDDEINQIVAQEILSNIGIHVSIANNGEEALNLLKKTPASLFDLVLMDVQMPVMDGFEATRQIRTYEHLQSLPIIAMTASVLQEDIQSCFDSGMNDHVSKPIDLEELYSALRKWACSPEKIEI